MFEDEKILTENTCCLCLNDDESTFSADSIMKSLPLHEMVNFCIGIELKNTHYNLSAICNECVLNVNNFYAFKQRILIAQKVLLDSADKELQNQNDEISMPDYSDEAAACRMEDPIQLTDEDVELLIVHDPDPTDGRRTETTTKKHTTKTKTLPAQRRNPSKRKKIDDSLTNEKVAIQVNECLICPAVLSDILELNEHTATHTSIVCKVKSCGRNFIRYSNLKRHFVSAHSKPKPFVCDLCDLGFSFSVNLQTHAALHYSGKIQAKTNK